MKKIFLFLTCLLVCDSLCACDKKNISIPDIGGNQGSGDIGGDTGEITPFKEYVEYGKVDDSGDQIDVIHYLSFEVEGVEIVKILVFPLTNMIHYCHTFLQFH